MWRRDHVAAPLLKRGSDGLGADGALLGKDRQGGSHQAADRAFGDASEVLRENPVVIEGGAVHRADLVCPRKPEHPLLRLRFDSVGRNDLPDWDHEERAQLRREHPNIFGANEELHRERRRGGGSVLAAIDYHECLQIFGLLGNSIDGIWGGQENGGEEHDESGERGEQAVPETQRNEDESGASQSKKDSESEPCLRIAA